MRRLLTRFKSATYPLCSSLLPSAVLSKNDSTKPRRRPIMTHSTKDVQKMLQRTEFATSANDLKQLPESRSEIAFAGRSNAGKSSALNLITSKRNLARTSKTPGRTQLINYFTVKDDLYLVDLPGYGYAIVPERIRLHWQHILQNYFERGETLDMIIMLVDSRHPLTELDLEILLCLFDVHV